MSTMTDPIADFLTRIRNASKAGHATLRVPRSKVKLELARVLKSEGFIEGYIDSTEGHGNVKVFLRYDAESNGIIRGIERVSKPSRRVYVGRNDIPNVRNGLGVAIMTTPRGIITGKQAKTAGVGGEVICYIW